MTIHTNDHTLKLGSLVLPYPFFQAPLSGYSDYAMRKLAVEFGCPLTFAGVMLAKSASHPVIMKKRAFRPGDDEHPIGAQILGDNPELCVKAALMLVNAGYDIIDLNFACPAPKVLRRERGGFLLDQPEKVLETYRRVRESVSCPLTIKLRTGFSQSQESLDNFWKIAEQLAAEKVDAITVHGRAVTQRFFGKANWDILAELKRRFPGTIVIGSGDLFEPQNIMENLQRTGLDGVVIARGAVGNPWIFRDLKCLFEGKPIPAVPTLKEQKDMILRHFDLVCQIHRLPKAIGYFRKFSVRYSRFHPERKKVQKELLAAKKSNELLAAIDQWYPVN